MAAGALRGVRHGVRRARWWTRRWRRNRRADHLLVSFPKCGRTWLRLMLGEVLDRQFALGASVADRLDLTALGRPDGGVPRIAVTHDRDPHKRTPATIRRSKRRYRRQRVILLVRDPRDAVVSLYFQSARRREAGKEPYGGTLSAFLREARGSTASFVTFYNQWAARRDGPEAVLLVRYEDLHADPSGQLRRIVDFLGLPAVSDETIAGAVAASTFDRMRDLEAGDSAESVRLRPGRAGDVESFKTRQGQVGGHLDHVTADDAAWLGGQADQLDPWYGYGAAVVPD